MRELRVTSCGFGKTVEEVERRRFVKLKRCILEPAARGLWYLKFSDSKTMSFEEVDTTAFFLRAKDSTDGLCDDQTTRSVVELEEKPAATRIQQQRKFSSNADFIFSTKNSDCSTGSKILEQKTPPVEIRKDFSRVQGRIHAILSQSSVQATNQQVRDLGRIRAIELLPDFVQTAGFVLPDFTRYLYTRLQASLSSRKIKL
ncbi:hypothetical protein F511_20485 [Dorcoceras hygrometricum]|uniref:Uncharacterized protein n=1 Tax=Dorcoceras hygrometricum TaxID=472368 RepID=A0A2Z7CMI8_9LAMI|nr:hypothetical protein F511_20485 [Dorcoceras hygrometricum]